MSVVPRREGHGLDRFNDALRMNPEYRSFLQSVGVNPDGPVRLSSAQRSHAERWVRQRFPDLGGKFQIDPAGNINTDHGASTAWSNPYFRYPLLAAGAVGTAGALGAFSGAASAASAGTGGTLASSSLPVASLMGGPAAIASQGASAGIAAGGGAAARLAARHLPAGSLMGGPPRIASQGASRGIPYADILNAVTRGGGEDGGGSSWLNRLFRGLRDYGPAALAALPAAIGGLTNRGPSDTEKQLNDILGIAKSRIEGSEPLYQGLNSLAMGDLDVARSRRSANEPLSQALNAMVGAQMPDAYRNRG